MNLSKIFIERPVMTILVSLCAVCLGVSCYFALPVSNMPNVAYPVISISAAFPGASAETMAKLVARPIEQQVIAIEGVLSVYSQSFTGQSNITGTFALDRDIDGIVQDIQNALQTAQSQLPKTMPTLPSYTKVNPSEQPIVYVALSSDTMTVWDLYTQGAEVVQREFEMVEGVGQVTIYGAPFAVRVQVDAQKIASMGIGLADIAQAMDASNPNIPAGKLDGSTITFTLDPTGDRITAEDFKPVIVAYRDGAAIRLEDIADVVDGVEQRDLYTTQWVRGIGHANNSVVVAVIREPSANSVKVAANIVKKMEQLKSQIPGSIVMRVLYDRSTSVLQSVEDVEETLVMAFFLVVGVIFLFLARFRDTLVPVVALPMSIVITLIFMKLCNFSIDNLSLLAIVLAIGFVVDDAIVVLENTVRHIDAGQTPLQAAIEGAQEISVTVMSMSISLIAIFIPLIFMPGIMGMMLREFSITIALSIAASAVVSLTLSPLMCSYFLKKREGEKKENALERWSEHHLNRVIAVYQKGLRWFLDHKFWGLFAWVVCVIGTIYIGKLLPKTFLPPGDTGAVHGSFVAQNGTSPAQMQALQTELQNVLTNDPRVIRTFTVTGATASLTGNQGIMFSVLCDRKNRADITDVCSDLNEEMFKQVPGVRAGLAPIPTITFTTGSNTNTTGAAGMQYQFELSGNVDPHYLYDLTNQMLDKMRAVPGIIRPMSELDNDNPTLKVHIQRDRASALGITAEDVETALSCAYANYIASYIRTETDEFWAIVETKNKDRTWPADLNKIYVKSTVTGQLVPLLAIADISSELTSSLVKHKNQEPMTLISFTLDNSTLSLGDATQKVQEIARDVLPPNILAEFSGDAATFQQTSQSMGILLIIAIFAMYVVLGILYESFVQPFTILSTLPVAGFGGMLTLFIFQSEFSFYAMVGFFLLLGIVKKNGIMMVDFANQHMAAEKCGYEQAIIEAACVRFRPILMTGLAAIMGALPMALGYGADGKGRQPLGLMIVGGLIFSQVLTLYVTPVIFVYFERFREWANKHTERV